MKQCQEIKQNWREQETLISVFVYFLTFNTKVLFWKGNWVLDSNPSHL